MARLPPVVFTVALGKMKTSFAYRVLAGCALWAALSCASPHPRKGLPEGKGPDGVTERSPQRVAPEDMPQGAGAVAGTPRIRQLPGGDTVLSGTLVDDEGMPVAGARVWTATEWGLLTLQGSDFLAGPRFHAGEAVTDADGRFMLGALDPIGRSHALIARKRNHAELRLGEIRLVQGCELDVGTRVLRRGQPLTVEFVDQDGAPMQGVGLARIWSAGGQVWQYHPEWHGVSGSDGRVRTHEAPGAGQVADEPGPFSAIIPGQFCRDVPLSLAEQRTHDVHRYVLPPRRWIEGRIEGLPPGRRFAVSSGGVQALMPHGEWVLEQYAAGHPVLGNRSPIVETSGDFRIPTWTGHGDPTTRTQVVVHVQLDDGNWQPLFTHEIPDDRASSLEEQDGVYPALVVQVPPLLRVDLSSPRYPLSRYRVVVRDGRGDFDLTLQGHYPEGIGGGERFFAVPGLNPSAKKVTIAAWIPGFHDYEETLPIRATGGYFDAGALDLQPSSPTDAHFVDRETGAAVEGVAWKLWGTSDPGRVPRLLDRGASNAQGLTAMDLASSIQTLEPVTHPTYEWPCEEASELHVSDVGSNGQLEVRLTRRKHQRVRVVDEHGQPLAGHIVEAHGPATLTDENGEALVHGSPDEEGFWEVAVWPARVAAGRDPYRAYNVSSVDAAEIEGETAFDRALYDRILVPSAPLATVVVRR